MTINHVYAQEGSYNVTINIDNSSNQGINNQIHQQCKCIKYFGQKLRECMKTLSKKEQKINYLAMTEDAQMEYVKSLTLLEHIALIRLFEHDTEIGPTEQEIINQFKMIEEVYNKRNKLSPENTIICRLFPFPSCIPSIWYDYLLADYAVAKKKYFLKKGKT
ncbi:MAG: hypothetical protein ACOYT8_02755 [Candidatus Dependentiae bacterium]